MSEKQHAKITEQVRDLFCEILECTYDATGLQLLADALRDARLDEAKREVECADAARDSNSDRGGEMLIGMRVWLFLKWVWRIEEPHVPKPYRMGRRSIKWAWFEAGVVARTCYRIHNGLACHDSRKCG